MLSEKTLTEVETFVALEKRVIKNGQVGPALENYRTQLAALEETPAAMKKVAETRLLSAANRLADAMGGANATLNSNIRYEIEQSKQSALRRG